MPLTIEHHAVMFALLAKHAIEISGEKGKEAILAGMTRYGNERGRRMALNALERGDKLPLLNSQAYGEWKPDFPGQMEFGVTCGMPVLHTYIAKCAWCDAWAKHGLTEYGIVTYWSGVVDESDLCRLGDTPYGLTELLGLRRTEIDGMYDGETRSCMPAAGCTLPAAQASTLCEVAALDEENPAEPLSLYDEDYFAGHPAASVHRYGKGRAYYLASRFDEAFYRAFYHDAAKEIGLSPAWPEALPEGVLAVRRGSFVFVQNCTEQPATVGNTVLDRYRTAVWKDMDRIF